MAEGWRILRMTLYKWRHSWLWPLHLGAVGLAIALGLAYTAFFDATAFVGWSFFLELLAMAFPLVIAGLSAMVAEDEMAAGGGQWLLMQPRRLLALFVPGAVLLFGGWLATTASILGYDGLMTQFWEASLSVAACLKMATLLWLGEVIVYGWQLFLALRFGRTVTLTVGAVGTLLAALMQTGMGDGLWPFIPYGWGGRLMLAAFAQALGAPVVNFCELQLGLFLCILFTCGMRGVLGVWFSRWGGQRSD